MSKRFKVGDRILVFISGVDSRSATIVPYDPPGNYDYKIRYDNGAVGLVWDRELVLVEKKKPSETVIRLPNGDYLIRSKYDYLVVTPDLLQEIQEAIAEELS